MGYSEEEITKLLKDQSDLAFNAFVETYSNQLLRIAYVILGDKQLAEDIVQESFLALYQNINNIRGDSTLKTWVTRVTINKSKNVIRRNKFKSLFILDKLSLKDPSPSPDEALNLTEREKHIKTLLMSLPLKYKDVLYLHYYEEMKVKDIAKVLEISESGIKSRLQRGREHMKKLLQERGAY
ncbi:RNA polymerase sigma factor [Serpentinicella sp. ANB-PHB4]|uniref:RNA polymerase sigma factor n=1 Tax=Serpentinicella sp. ANB-PHB4 TaxID=3074076 RepID=UPI00285FA7BE|nr:RNA polymerase sigma factor [Serpentinicella sp. ANB-PHB4]MDR5659270.1 RNA polymerase sigma factor [Serpentinicella sp. ANB-PHB4]